MQHSEFNPNSHFETCRPPVVTDMVDLEVTHSELPAGNGAVQDVVEIFDRVDMNEPLISLTLDDAVELVKAVLDRTSAGVMAARMRIAGCPVVSLDQAALDTAREHYPTS